MSNDANRGRNHPVHRGPVPEIPLPMDLPDDEARLAYGLAVMSAAYGYQVCGRIISERFCAEHGTHRTAQVCWLWAGHEAQGFRYCAGPARLN